MPRTKFGTVLLWGAISGDALGPWAANLAQTAAPGIMAAGFDFGAKFFNRSLDIARPCFPAFDGQNLNVEVIGRRLLGNIKALAPLFECCWCHVFYAKCAGQFPARLL